jgi:hypothetical protein
MSSANNIGCILNLIVDLHNAERNDDKDRAELISKALNLLADVYPADYAKVMRKESNDTQ